MPYLYLLGKVPKQLWVALAILIVLGMVYGAGLKSGIERTEAEYDKHLAKAQKEQLEKLEKARQIQIDLQAKLSNAEIKTKVITKRVKVYVKDEQDIPACDPNVGTVRLLNDARRDALPETPAELTEEDRAPSGIGLAGLVESDIELAGACNAIRYKYHALIDWVETNYE